MKAMKQESVLISKELVNIHGMNSGELSYYSLVPTSWLHGGSSVITGSEPGVISL